MQNYHNKILVIYSPLTVSVLFGLIYPLYFPLHRFVSFYDTEALRLVVETAKSGVSVLSLCEKGDAYIMAETGKVFKKEKEMKKGEGAMRLCMPPVYLGDLRGAHEKDHSLNRVDVGW